MSAGGLARLEAVTHGSENALPSTVDDLQTGVETPTNPTMFDGE